MQHVTNERHQTPTLDVLHPVHRHEVDLSTRPDTDPVAALFRLELTQLALVKTCIDASA